MNALVRRKKLALTFNNMRNIICLISITGHVFLYTDPCSERGLEDVHLRIDGEHSLIQPNTRTENIDDAPY